MSGHSKWSTIKRQKAVTDSRRSAVFTKLGRLVTIAAREGGDPEMNFKLRLAIDQAKAANVPNDNIDRAIRAGTGGGRGSQTKEAVYEGFGPGQVAIMVEVVTDNPNRTAAELRQLFQKFGGVLGAQNSVGWMFQLRGIVRLPVTNLPLDLNAFALAAIDHGAEDISEEDETIVLQTSPEKLTALRAWIDDLGTCEVTGGPELIPQSNVTVVDTDRPQLYALFEALDEHPDVISIISNEA